MFERLTRLARGMKRQIDVTFENRASLSIPDVVSYLKMLETYPGPYGSPTIPAGLVHGVTAQAKGNSKMLQVADCCAGALNNALEPDPYGGIEDGYILSLAPKLDRSGGKLWGHGLKFFPAKTAAACLARRPEYTWLNDL